MKNKLTADGYNSFVQEIKQRIRAAQYEALKAVNKEMILLYLDIGKMIVENQKKHGWGKAIVETLAKDLQAEFPGVAGYSADNLWRMRKFYLNYANKPKLAPLVQEIAWAHNIVIMEKCKDDLPREFYLRMTVKFGWKVTPSDRHQNSLKLALESTSSIAFSSPSPMCTCMVCHPRHSKNARLVRQPTGFAEQVHSLIQNE